MANIFAFESIEEAMAAIEKGLQKNCWKDNFCTFINGEKTVSYHTEEEVKQMSFMIAKGYFLSEEYMMSILHDILIGNIKPIAEWLLSKKRQLTIEAVIPMAVPLYKDGEEIMKTHIVHMYLRKDHSGKLPYGFFVSSFQAMQE